MGKVILVFEIILIINKMKMKCEMILSMTVKGSYGNMESVKQKKYFLAESHN